MEILLVPNELLRQKANRLINITSEDIKIAYQMMDTMIKAPGVGLAANQVGILKQIITINFEDKENDKRANYILFNPSIIEYSEEKVIMEEGCLSLPEQYADIERPKQIVSAYLDSLHWNATGVTDAMRHLERYGEVFCLMVTSLLGKCIVE